MIKTSKWLLPALGLLLAGAAVAQTAEGVKFYKLDFAVKEVEGGKVVNSRTFSTMLSLHVPGSSSPQSSIRSGGRVPVTTGNGTSFFDLGVNLDVRELRESAQGDVSVFITADISTIAQETPSAIPVVRQNKWTGAVLIPLKKPTVVFTSDDLSSKRQVQLELTATPMK